jgi:uncharacterized membrane protein
MTLDPEIWAKMHGASVHFPMALAMAAALFDGAGFFWAASSPRKMQLHAAGHFTIILGALGTFPAVLSGLLMTKGEVMGHGALLFHHLFVWPAFAGIVALGVWRALMSERISPRSFRAYLAALFLTSGLMAGAGYWGGELLLNS